MKHRPGKLETLLEFFVAISLLAGTTILGLKLALFEQRRTAVIVGAVATLHPLALTPLYVNVPWATVRTWLGEATALEAISALLACEAMISVGLAIVVLRKHYVGRAAARWSGGLFPPIAFCLPLNIAHIGILNHVSSISFTTTVGLTALATASILLVVTVSSRLLFRWPTRMELLLAALGVQLVVSVAIPMLSGTAVAPASANPMSLPALGAFSLLCITGLSGGFAWNKFRKKLK